MATPKTILIITQPEMGQANCQFATLYEYITHPTPLSIHFLSHKEVIPRVHKFIIWASREVERPNEVTVHEIESSGMIQAVGEAYGGISALEDKMLYKPSFFGLWKAFGHIGTVMYPWNRDQTIDIFNTITKVINSVKPDIAQVDNLHLLARDACRKAGQDVVVVSPNTIKDVGTYAQSFKTMLDWGLPGTAKPIPLPWYLYPWFFILQIRIIFTFLFSSGARRTAKYRKELGIDFLPALLDNEYPNEHKVVCMTTPELDVPGIIPKKIACVGPMVQKVVSLESKDAELLEWINQAPTIMIVLGSHYRMDKDYADHVAHALKVICETRPDVQVLWKYIPMENKEVSDLRDVKELIKEDRVRVVDWFEADPAAVLDTGKVCVAVNHGGSNSYHEALYYGVPQVIMPSWFDCYDFAIRAGMFGVGEWGNRKACPRIERNEFAQAILKVIGSTPNDAQAKIMRERCLECRDIVRAQGGRKKAVEVVLEVMNGIVEKKQAVQGNGNGSAVSAEKA